MIIYLIGFHISTKNADNKITCEKYLYMSRDVRKPDFCICENKGADQLRGNCAADQCLCFRYFDSTIPLFP